LASKNRLAVGKVTTGTTTFCYTVDMEDSSKIKLKQLSGNLELRKILRQNIKLTKENNLLLRKLQRQNLIFLWLRVVWFAILIGLPFIMYYALGPILSDFQNLLEMYEIPTKLTI